MDKPEIDESKTASLARKFYDTLVALQFAPAQSIQTLQDNVLRDLIEHVAAENAFYRDRLAPLFAQGKKADLAEWSKVPILTAAEVTAHHDSLRARTIPKAHGRIFRYQSSGTTGNSLAYYRSQLDELATSCCQYRHLHAIGADWSKDLALIRAFDPALLRFRKTQPEGARRVWGPKWLAAEELGAIQRLSVFTPLKEQMTWLNELGEIYLNTFPSNALALARYARSAGAPKPKLAAVFTAGEPLTSDVRHEVEATFGCSCFDIISNAELGIIACECPSRQGYHLQSELVRIELLDERDQPVKEGQWGRVIATPLYNFAMPLIRYDTGDWAKLKGPCSCGRQHPVVDPVYGRPSNLLHQGESAWMRPVPASAEMDKFLPDCRWQLVQTSSTQVELRYMRHPQYKAIRTADAARYVTSIIGTDITVAVREVAALGLNAGGKFSVFIGLKN
jgi:phenylacetate-CoA ligase